jgi:hypothetical protein
MGFVCTALLGILISRPTCGPWTGIAATAMTTVVVFIGYVSAP